MIKYQENNVLEYGCNEVTTEESSMLMDFHVYKLRKDDQLNLSNSTKEMAIILFSGSVRYKWKDNEVLCERNNVFDHGPYVLHIPKGVEVHLDILVESEIGVQKATNENNFESKFYTPEECVDNIFGDGLMQGTARRLVRDVFNYNNAPYSNMVMGEVITYPGRWSSYPPHSHKQPEIYYYKFTKEQGFGCSIIGEDIYKIQNNSAALIDGDLVHPQVTAPGYGMYYCWMIRHLEGNPWNERVDDPDHSWLHDKNAKIWSQD